MPALVPFPLPRVGGGCPSMMSSVLRPSCAHLPPSSLIQVLGILSDIFEEFDSLCEKHRVDKIKTIGDAYIVCTGCATRLLAETTCL